MATDELELRLHNPLTRYRAQVASMTETLDTFLPWLYATAGAEIAHCLPRGYRLHCFARGARTGGYELRRNGILYASDRRKRTQRIEEFIEDLEDGWLDEITVLLESKTAQTADAVSRIQEIMKRAAP
jgi:hypothetical protein